MTSKKMTGWLIGLILLCHIILCVAAYPLQAEEPAKTPENAAELQTAAVAPEPEGMKGIALYYDDKYQGRVTHSGEIFDQSKMTAAHPSLPHGTRVKVVNLANDRSVIVTINDRCRKRPFELIDVTKTAAKELGFYGKKGTAKVRLIVLTGD